MRNVIFDFGNVINHWEPFRALNSIFDTPEAMQQAFEEIGFYGWNREQDRGRSWQDGIALVERENPDHAHIFRAYVNGLGSAHEIPVPGTHALVERLHAAGIALFGLTNASLKTVEVLRVTAPVLDLMQDIVISAEVELIKPDPRIFRLCLERNHLDPAETMFVDDMLENCQGAESVGLKAHHFVGAEGLERDLIAMALLLAA